jgi:hypothetical protein
MSNLKNTLNADLNVEKSSNQLMKKIMNMDLTNFKIELMNLLQYAFLSIVPVVLTLKLIKNVIPSVDETKGSLELLFESVGQISLTIFLLLLIHTLVRLVPTYSGENYTNLDTLSFVVPFLFLMLTMQTKIGEKINILSQRLVDYWNGSTTNNKPNVNNDNNNNHNLLPNNTNMSSMPSMPNPENKQVNVSLPPAVPTQQTNGSHSHMNYQVPKPDFNNMYEKSSNNSNNMMSMNQSNTLSNNEPIAANLGVNSAYSSW